MNEEIIGAIESLMKPGEVFVFHMASTGELVWNRHPNLEQFCLETLEGLRQQREFHKEE